MPFLQKKQAVSSGVIVKTREPDETSQPNDEDAAIDACANELIRAIHARDAKAVSMALKDAVDIINAMPQDESNDYDAQNIKAGQGQE